MPSKERPIYFDPVEHKYTDELGNVYTSVTTVLGGYKRPFDMDKWAQYTASKYGGSAREVKENWINIKDTACERGNIRHNWLDDIIKLVNGYIHRAAKGYTNGRMYTIADLKYNPNYGSVSLDELRQAGLETRYPEVFAVIKKHTDEGWKIYSEVCVYWADFLIAGMIDVCMIKGTKFRILDWKTNRKELKYVSGYYKKDARGKKTNQWIDKKTYLEFPLEDVEECKGSEYTLQLSLYAYLVSLWGFELDITYWNDLNMKVKSHGLILTHIRPKEYDDEHPEKMLEKEIGEEEIVEFHNIPYWKDQIVRVCNHHTKKIANSRNFQISLNI